MALPTGEIYMSQVRAEVGGSGQISLNDAAVRSLAGRPSGQISMADLRGKSRVPTVTVYTGSYFYSGVGTYRGFLASGTPFGSMSSSSYGGRTITGAYALSTGVNRLSVSVAGTTVPGWTRVWVNGTSYAISFTTVATKGVTTVIGAATIANMYGIAASNFTIGFQ